LLALQGKGDRLSGLAESSQPDPKPGAHRVHSVEGASAARTDRRWRPMRETPAAAIRYGPGRRRLSVMRVHLRALGCGTPGLARQIKW
jgi:hypothetical protein